MASWYEGLPMQGEDSTIQTKFLTCSICDEPYDDNTHQAKFLSCHHTFCSRCLTEVSKRQDNPGVIPCPICRHYTQIPVSGITGLQRNFYIDDMTKISKTTAKYTENNCCKHDSKLLFFCETCKKAICRDCTVLDHNISTGHVIVDISEAEVSHRQILLQQMNEQRISLTQIQSNMEKLQLEMALLAATKETTKEELKQFMQLAQKKLKDRENELITSNEEHFKQAQDILLTKQTPLRETIDALSKNLNQAENLMKNGTLDEVIAINQTLMGSAKDMQSSFVELNLGKNHLTLDSKTRRQAFERCLCDLGRIQINDALPANFKFDCKESSAGEKTEMQVRLFNHQCKPIPCTPNHFTAEITDPEGTTITSVLTTTEHGYTVTFTPQMSGPHKVSGMFLGQQLINEQNQISVSSNNPVLKFGKYGNGGGTFNGPCGIAIGIENCLYIADYHNGLIQMFTADEKFLFQFSVAVHGKEFTTKDIAFDVNRRLLLCPQIDENMLCPKGKSILAFNIVGELQHTYTTSKTTNADFIAINSQQELIISDTEKKCLRKTDRKGKFLCKIGSIKKPGCIAIADDDSIIVPDRGDDCVYIFNPDGTVRHKFGTSGKGKGQLNGPLGVATDGEYILVSEVGNTRIQVFKQDTSFVSMIESREDPISLPYGMAVTKDGHVYVADTWDHCIRKYKYRNMP